MATDLTRDDDLMDRLRRLAGTADPVPESVKLAGRSAIAHRDLDLRLAELVEAETVAATRGEDEPVLTFEVDDVMIELALRRRSGALHLVGQIDGAEATSVTIRNDGAGGPVSVDSLGRFSTGVETGPLRVEVSLDDGRRIATSWIVAT